MNKDLGKLLVGEDTSIIQYQEKVMQYEQGNSMLLKHIINILTSNLQ